MSIKVLSGHVSPESAYVVDDYPYGFRLRCQMRYWLEVNKTHGVRMLSQSSNPKRPGLVWNKPKASTYSRFGAALFLDDNGHVHCAGLSEYSTGADCKAFADTYRAGVPESALDTFDRWVAAKLAYDAKRQPLDPLGNGLAEARKAFVTKQASDRFRRDNTEGYSDSDLAKLNAEFALHVRKARDAGDDVSGDTMESGSLLDHIAEQVQAAFDVMKGEG